MKKIELQKKLSPLNVSSLAFGCIIGFGAFVLPGTTFLAQAGPLGTAIAMAIAVVIMIIISFNYHYMILKYPVAGGEFKYAQSAFGKNHAYWCAWFLALSYITLVPMNATALALIGRNLFVDLFQVGFYYNIAGYDVYFGEICLAVVAIVLFGYFSVRGVAFTGKIQTFLSFILILGVFVLVVAAIVSPKATVENLEPAFNPDVSEVAGILAVLAVAPFAFVGFDTIPQSAEEYKFSPRKTKWIMVFAISFGACIYIALNTLTASVIPSGFSSWNEYIMHSSELSGLLSLPTFHAAKELLGDAGLFFIGIAILGAVLSGIVGFYMAGSRLLYSMAKEKVITDRFSILHKQYETPVNAIMFILIISLIAPFFGRTVLGWLVDMSSLGAAIGFGYTSAAAIKFAKQEKNTVIMVTGFIGVIMSMIFAILLLVPIPVLNCSLGIESYICLIIWIVLGIVFRKSKNKQM